MRALWKLGASGALVTVLGCGGTDLPRRDCTSRIWVEATGSPGVRVLGSWDGWAPAGRAVDRFDDRWNVLRLDLPPGEYGYLLSADGLPRLDPTNPLTTFHGEEEVSLLVSEDCSTPEIAVEEISSTDDGAVSIRATFRAASDGEPLDPSRLSVSTADGERLHIDLADEDSGAVVASARGLGRGKHTIRLQAADASGRRAEDVRANAWVRPRAATWGDGVLYQLMVDRFRGDGGAPLAAPVTPGSRAGGTLDGVRAEIEAGMFDALGVTALWLSPVYQNPEEGRIGSDGHLYESYHGYWPVEPRRVDPRLGGEAALDAVIDAAHARGIRVLFDLVPNHVYETSARYLEHARDGWFHVGSGECVCGAPGCSWSDHIESCWFTPFLPDVRWQNADAMRLGVDDARWWTDRFDADGVRIDAVPMLPRATTRRLAHALRSARAVRDDTFVLGEVYTGPGEAGLDTIRYYLGPAGLDSPFDFPLMWALRDAIAADRAGFDDIEALLAREESVFDGFGAIPARILDNHDTSRFLSVANGEDGADGWSSTAPEPAGPEPYARLRLGLALLFTLPGVPVLYQGDEVAVPGGRDPDCRRVLPGGDAVPALATEVLRTTGRLGQLRACLPALRRGKRLALSVLPDTYAFARDAGDGAPAIVLMSKSRTPSKLELPAGSAYAGEYVDALGGEAVTLDPHGATIELDPFSIRILVPASSACSVAGP